MSGESKCDDLSFVDMASWWPEQYAKLKDESWFQKIAKFYYESDGECKGLYTEVPIYKAWVHVPWEGDQDELNSNSEFQSISKARGPHEPLWWVMPYHCHVINGVFLYLVLDHLGYKPQIMDSPGHTFCMANSGKGRAIFDLYWQPLGYDTDSDKRTQYIVAKPVDKLEFWEEHDALRFLVKDGIIK